MDELEQRYCSWILDQQVCGAVPRAVDDDHIVIEVESVVAEVNLYRSHDSRTIVELLVMTSPDEVPAFFLHFVLEDLPRAQELFEEMAQALESEMGEFVTKVLLCCTSGMTTTFLASKMGEVAHGLSLPYEFAAMSFDRALNVSDEYEAILLAPQVGHLRQEMVAAHPHAVVFEIPGKVFGSYDAASAIELLMHALHDVHAPSDDVGDLHAMRDLSNDKRILVITLFVLRRDVRLGYRLYDHGQVASFGTVRKAKLDYRDIEDLIETIEGREINLGELDAIGIAVPGVAYRGTVSLPGMIEHDYDLGKRITERFGVRVHVDNNCNAAAAGCYVLQDEYQNLVFYRHEFGHIAGGLGTIIDGRLLKGWRNLAGETRFFEHTFAYDGAFEDACWSSAGLQRMVKNVVLSEMSLVSPEAVFLSVDTVDDMDALREVIAEDLPCDLVPALVPVDDYFERVYLGEMALCLQKIIDPEYRSHGVI